MSEKINKQVLHVTVSRLPESVIEELEEHIGYLHDEYDLDSDHMNTFQAIVIGYGAAWDAIQSYRIDEPSDSDQLREEKNRIHELYDAQYARSCEYFGEIQRLRSAVVKAERFISNVMSFCGEGIEVVNWHQNGDTEPLDNIFESNMDGDELEVIREALSTTTEQTGADRVREAWEKIPSLPIERGDHSIYRAGFIDGISAAGITIPGINAAEEDSTND